MVELFVLTYLESPELVLSALRVLLTAELKLTLTSMMDPCP